jgi:hypothetical protein
MWVLAPLRHRQFFSLAEANTAPSDAGTSWKDFIGRLYQPCPALPCQRQYAGR